MKFTVAWAKVASENSILKTVILCLGTLCLFFSASSLKLALKEPIVIERACYSEAAVIGDGKRTTKEVESFLKEALAQRFDTQTAVHNAFLSDEERVLRTKEQKELQSRKLRQRVILNSAVVDGNNVVVDADRLISVGDVRSALRFPLNVKIESVTRSQDNPYGLIVSEIKTIEKRGK